MLGKPSDRLLQALHVGMVRVDDPHWEAVIVAPPEVETLTDDEWLTLLRVATELIRELQYMGYTVRG